MAIIINNTATVKIDSCKESIEYILNELSEYWSATSQDQQGFHKELKDNANVLNNICTCNRDFSSAIVQYMEVTEGTSNKTVG